MKVKLLVTLIFTFSVSVYAQIDVNQLEALQKLQQDSQDIDEPVDSADNMIPLEKEAATDEQETTTDTMDDFGYQGRNDFLVAPNSKFSNEPLVRFGYDYFVNDPSTFLPAKDTPIPSDYVVGPGDVVKIILFGNQNKKYTLQVTREGDIFLPEIGPLAIAGLTFQDVKETINQIINNQLIGTKASLTLGNLRSINIFILGEASKPGMYRVSALSTLTNAVFTNGGIKSTGSLRNIQLKRNGEIVSNFDFYNLLLKGDTSNDLRLRSGDVIFIPPAQKLIGIAGEVKRPGIYELKDNENAEDLINFAGKLKAKANLSSIEIERIDAFVNAFSLIHVDLDTSPFSKLELKDGDKLSIYPVTEKLNNAVLLRGHTQKPGFYPWVEGMRILDIIPSKNDLLPMTDMNYILIKRESRIGLRYEFIQVDFQELFDDSASTNNIILANRDEIIFFPSMLDINLIQTVLTEREYVNNDQQLATYYAKKSIKESNLTPSNVIDPTASTTLSEKKYFYYYVYDYCVVPENLLIELLDAQSDEEIDPQEFSAVPTNTDFKELEANESSVKIISGKNLQLTRHCRQQIIDPILALIEQQSIPSNPEQTITIFGNVLFPGKYPLTHNSTIKDGLKAAGGLKGLSFLDEIDVSKKTYPGKKLLETNQSIRFSELQNYALDPLDIITIKQLQYKQAVADIFGEVYFPGSYPISENETLSSLIKRAGGFTDKAGIANTFFQRKSLINSELKRFNQAQANVKKQLLLSSTQGIGDSDNTSEYLDRILLLTQETPDISLLGRLVIDIEDLLKDPLKDIRLVDRDSITVPQISQTVKVIGEVHSPNSHLYNSQLTAYNYMDLSGGVNDLADIKNTYIIKANGSISNLSSSGFFRNSSDYIEPGDTIVVPINFSTFSSLKATTEITQIIYQMALSAAAVKSF